MLEGFVVEAFLLDPRALVHGLHGAENAAAFDKVKRGWEAAGVEINAAAARHCREARALDVRDGTLDDGPFPPASFGAVVMADVIEHLPDPRRALEQVRELLEPGGLVAISTPDVSGWAARLLQVKPVEHLYYFEPATLRALLGRAGPSRSRSCLTIGTRT